MNQTIRNNSLSVISVVLPVEFNFSLVTLETSLELTPMLYVNNFFSEREKA